MKSGFVAIVGRPNVGKSTLLNQLVGEKLAGVSNKPQTTRNCIRGIVTRPQGQIVFLDTPGMHTPRDRLGRWMVKEAQTSLDGADVVYWMVLPGEINSHDGKILKLVRELKKPIYLVINQVDRYPKPHILPVLEYYHKAFQFQEMIPVSALTGEQVDLLVEKTFESLPEGSLLYAEDQISDQNVRFLAGELIREKLFRYTQKEIPYGTAVIIDEFKERDERITDIEATVIVDKESQKAIVIGKGGEMMKKIGGMARKDLEQLLGKKVFLKLWVKTLPGWKDSKTALGRLGYQ
ncbi:MAG: GTPase Era [Candidatus Omnitrophota bacterium]|nr:GTPase Era [Candidatus Omnitrophota bacterium]